MLFDCDSMRSLWNSGAALPSTSVALNLLMAAALGTRSSVVSLSLLSLLLLPDASLQPESEPGAEELTPPCNQGFQRARSAKAVVSPGATQQELRALCMLGFLLTAFGILHAEAASGILVLKAAMRRLALFAAPLAANAFAVAPGEHALTPGSRRIWGFLSGPQEAYTGLDV